MENKNFAVSNTILYSLLLLILYIALPFLVTSDNAFFADIWWKIKDNANAIGIAFSILLLLIGVISMLVDSNRDAKAALLRERRQKELNQQLNDEKALVERESMAKSNFLFNMSHDIRTPMNAVIGFTHMAKEHVDNPELVHNYLDKVIISSDLLLNIINDVLEMARIEAGKLTSEETPGNVLDCIERFHTVTAENAEAKGLNFNVDIQDIIHPAVYMDVPHFERVILNLISNAVKYTPQGGSVRLCARELPSGDADRGLYEFIVEDNGIGMSEEFQKHLFENFSREKNTTLSGVQGTGLGMAIAKNMLDLMGGTISVKSVLGKGTVFTVRIPFRLRDELSEAQTKPLRAEQVELAGRRVLLAEDNDLNREIAMDILKTLGVEVESVVNGQEAVDTLLIKGPEYFDFVLMDVQMPVLDGNAATREIRTLPDEGFARLPILAMTANAFDSDIKASLDAGMNAHIAKPINIEVMVQTIGRCLQEREGA